MNLSDYVVSLEIAKRLKELGITYPSLFCWTTDLDLEYIPSDIRNEKVCIAAYTAQELWNIIENYHFHINKDENGTHLYFSPEGGTDNSYTFTDNNIANNLAKMVLAQHRENEYANMA